MVRVWPIFEPFCLFRCHYEMKVSSFSTKIRLPKQKPRPERKVANFPPTDGSVSGSPRYSPTEQTVEPLLHPPAAEHRVDHRVAAPHVGNPRESLPEPGARHPDLPGSRSDEPQPAVHLPERNDLPANLAPRSLPAMPAAPARQLFVQLLPIDILAVRPFCDRGPPARDRRRRRPGCPARSPPTTSMRGRKPATPRRAPRAKISRKAVEASVPIPTFETV